LAAAAAGASQWRTHGAGWAAAARRAPASAAAPGAEGVGGAVARREGRRVDVDFQLAFGVDWLALLAFESAALTSGSSSTSAGACGGSGGRGVRRGQWAPDVGGTRHWTRGELVPRRSRRWRCRDTRCQHSRRPHSRRSRSVGVDLELVVSEDGGSWIHGMKSAGGRLTCSSVGRRAPRWAGLRPREFMPVVVVARALTEEGLARRSSARRSTSRRDAAPGSAPERRRGAR
jgi:hypothetical protein